MSFKTLLLAMLSLTTILTACAPLKPTNESPYLLNNNSVQTQLNEAKPKQQTETITSWENTGAIAAHHNNKGWTATFNWVQRGADNYQMRLIGPLGGGTVLIDRQNGITTYRDGSKATSARNADDLLKQKTGVALPVKNLYYWVRGLPAPGSAKIIKHDSLNHLKLIQQAGYTIEYLSTTNVKGIELPTRIKLQGKGVLIKVAIKQWNF